MGNYMWLSFASEDTGKNLGVCIVEAENFTEGIQKAHQKDINPGGQVAGFKMNEEQFQGEELELDRLYSREEMKAMEFRTLGEAEEELNND